MNHSKNFAHLFWKKKNNVFKKGMALITNQNGEVGITQEMRSLVTAMGRMVQWNGSSSRKWKYFGMNWVELMTGFISYEGRGDATFKG